MTGTCITCINSRELKIQDTFDALFFLEKHFERFSKIRDRERNRNEIKIEMTRSFDSSFFFPSFLLISINRIAAFPRWLVPL